MLQNELQWIQDRMLHLNEYWAIKCFLLGCAYMNRSMNTCTNTQKHRSWESLIHPEWNAYICYTHWQQYCNYFKIQLLYVVPTANRNFLCKHDSIHISAHPPVVVGTFHSDQHQIVYIHYHDTKWLTAFLLSHSSEHSVAQIKCSLRSGITEVIYLRTWQILDSCEHGKYWTVSLVLADHKSVCRSQAPSWDLP